MANHPVAITRLRVFLGLALAIATIAVVLWTLQSRPDYQDSTVAILDPAGSPATSVPAPSPPSPSSHSLPSPSEILPRSSPTVSSTSPPAPESQPSPGSSNFNSSNFNLASELPADALNVDMIVPVEGVRPDQLRDTFNESRSEGRKHDAIDILAPAGTPVLAADDGEIIKLFQSNLGGTTIYQHSARDKQLVFYYAHLQRYADGLAVGRLARKGEVIGYVGDTGNASAGNYHLHFSVFIVADPKRYWEGKNINPYPLLRR